MTPAETCKHQIAELASALHASHPTMPVLLRTIHQNLKKDPDIVTALNEEEIATIISSLKKQTGIELIAATMNKKSGKSMKNMGVLDL